MPANAYYEYLQSCLALVSQTLGAEESILVVEQGQTRYAKQTFAYYRVRIGTFERMTGHRPVNLRSAVVEVNVDQPSTARYVDESAWLPLET